MGTTLRVEIFPADLDACVRFWTRALGFALERDERGTAARYVALRRDAVLVGAAERDPVADPEARVPPTGVEIVLEVDDLAAERERVLAAGWPLDEDVTARPWGLTDLRVRDPDGYYVRLTSR